MTQIQLLNDDLIIESLKKGETDLLGQFYLANKREFIHWAEKNYKSDRSDMLDIFQDSMVILYENIISGRFVRTNSTLKTYLFAIAKNILMKKHRDSMRVSNLADEADKIEMEEDYFDYERDSKFEIAMQAYAEMKEPCKSILKMYYYQKLSMDEIAGNLGYKSGDVVKSQKLRCIRSLRDMTNSLLSKD